MNDIFKTIEEYKNEFIDVLKKNKTHFDSKLTEYSTPSNNFKIKYFKWQHPYQGNHEYDEIFTDGILSYLSTIIKPHNVVIDVGAKVGLMSVSYAQFANKVISFEPNPAAFEVLNKNCELYNNIVTYNFACSTEESSLQFHYSDEGLCNGGFATNCEKGIGVTGHVIPIDVYAVNLNEFLNKYHKDDIKNLSLIKTDTEGHDKDVLKTIYPIIQSVRPILFSELYPDLTENEVKDLIKTIKDVSYKIYDINKNNAGMWNENYRKEINSINDVRVGQLCNLLCIPV